MVKKQPKMRVMQRDLQEYQRLRKNYRSKLWRIRRKTNFSLPAETIDKELDLEFPSIDAFKDGHFDTRKDYNAFKAQVKETTSRGFKPLLIKTNSSGMNYPAVIEQMGWRSAKRAQAKAEEEIDKVRNLPLIIDGEERGRVADREMGSPDSDAFGIYKPSDFNIEDYVSPQSVEKRIKKDEERQTDDYFTEKKNQMFENYISIFDGKEGDLQQEIADKLKQINPDEFFEIYLQLPEMSFTNWDSETGFHIEGEDTQFHKDLLYFLDMYLDGGIDISLKDIG